VKGCLAGVRDGGAGTPSVGGLQGGVAGIPDGLEGRREGFRDTLQEGRFQGGVAGILDGVGAT
jgi:hypothetical protein